MKIIIGQGNPGAEYTNTRHNLGFLALDFLAKQWDGAWQKKDRFKAEVAETQREGEKLLLVKPLTFYNETGQSARALLDFYKLSVNDLLVIHDELALPFGTIRTRGQGGDAGNNGIKSLITHVGDQFGRIRVGIANERSSQQEATRFVLDNLTIDEQKALPELFKIITSAVNDFAKQHTMEHKSHSI